MWNLKKKRTTLEKLTNEPVTLTVGTRKEQRKYELREPTMREFINSLESAIGEMVPVYADNFEQMAARAVSAGFGLADFKMLEPAFTPVCKFIAMIADKPDDGEWIAENITPSQFIECVNLVLYLIDIQVMWANFSDALTRMMDARKGAKKGLSAH